jgi:hypothetical protein
MHPAPSSARAPPPRTREGYGASAEPRGANLRPQHGTAAAGGAALRGVVEFLVAGDVLVGQLAACQHRRGDQRADDDASLDGIWSDWSHPSLSLTLTDTAVGQVCTR